MTQVTASEAANCVALAMTPDSDMQLMKTPLLLDYVGFRRAYPCSFFYTTGSSRLAGVARHTPETVHCLFPEMP